jgi:hypothetical protein
MLLIVGLDSFDQSAREGLIRFPSFSGYKNNIVIKESGAHSCWVSDSASIKETCILWVPGYINTGWRGKHLKRREQRTETEERALGDEIDPQV